MKVPRESREWGGTWGKACGHNEVVMHVMRPFAPLEVVNTRVCSFVDLARQWRLRVPRISSTPVPPPPPSADLLGLSNIALDW